MTTLQAIVMAILQGITELFPISSLGHAVIVPALLHWGDIEKSADWLPFLAVMHLGTAIALLLYFWRDWFDFLMAVVFRRGPRPAEEGRLFWRVVVATIPAVILGAGLEHILRKGFGAPTIAAGFLIANGVMLFVADRWRGRSERSLDQLRWGDALVIGLWQCLALIPGFSRSGATMAGGYLAGLKHEDAARFSFLTATPIILAATGFEAPKLLHHHAAGAPHTGLGHVAILAGVVAGVMAFISVWALMRWFRAHEEEGGFTPFAVYCVVAGAGSLAWMLMH